MPLITVREIADEAKAMDNCLLRYTATVATDRCRLFSLRAGDTRVATIEVVRNPITGRFMLSHIEGPRHQHCIPDLQSAMTEWIARLPLPSVTPSLAADAAAADVRALVPGYHEAVPVEEHARLDAWTWGQLRADIEQLHCALPKKSIGSIGGLPIIELYRPQPTVVVVERRSRLRS